MYEACALGTPAIVISQNQGQDDEARLFAQEGAIFNLGQHSEINDSEIEDTIKAVLSNKSLRDSLSQKARKLIDPFGAERITKVIIEDFVQRHYICGLL